MQLKEIKSDQSHAPPFVKSIVPYFFMGNNRTGKNTGRAGKIRLVSPGNS